MDGAVIIIDESDHLRSIRMIPIFGRRHQLVDLLNEMGMYPAGLPSHPEEGGLWIPNRMCRVDGERM